MQEMDMEMNEMPVRAVSEQPEALEEKKADEAALLPGTVITDEALKQKYGQVFSVSVIVDEDDENEGRKLEFIFHKPTAATFNRYLKTASKNMAASTVVFVQDNIIDEHKERFARETEAYPGLALNIGQKLLSTIGLGDNVNFKRL